MDVHARIIPESGSSWDEPIVVAGDLDAAESRPSVAALPGGGFAVLHETDENLGDLELAVVDGSLPKEADALRALLASPGGTQHAGSVIRGLGGLWFSFGTNTVGASDAVILYYLPIGEEE